MLGSGRRFPRRGKGSGWFVEGATVGAVELNRYAEAAQVVVSPKRTFDTANYDAFAALGRV